LSSSYITALATEAPPPVNTIDLMDLSRELSEALALVISSPKLLVKVVLLVLILLLSSSIPLCTFNACKPL